MKINQQLKKNKKSSHSISSRLILLKSIPITVTVRYIRTQLLNKKNQITFLSPRIFPPIEIHFHLIGGISL